MSYQQLFEAIEKRVELHPEDQNACQTHFEFLEVEKNSILENLGKRPRHLYFILSGYMRLFYYDQKGNEVTTRICGPNDFITPFLAFVHKKEARENTASITNCQLMRISQERLEQLIFNSPTFRHFSVVIFEQAIEMIENRANDLATLNAEERYRKLLEEQADIVQYVPIQQIASYLGMKPESLSRIRRKI